MDRIGADPKRVVSELESKLGHVAVPIQLPIGAGDDFKGVIDVIAMKAIYFDGEDGENLRSEEIPADMMHEARRARHGGWPRSGSMLEP